MPLLFNNVVAYTCLLVHSNKMLDEQELKLREGLHGAISQFCIPIKCHLYKCTHKMFEEYDIIIANVTMTRLKVI